MSMNKRVFTMMMMIALLMAIFVPKAWGQQAEDPWDGETKTEVTPEGDIYKITTGAELAWVASQSSYLFKGKTIQLVNDIDLGDKEWTPILSFKGTFDGQGHTIKKLNINIDLPQSTDQYLPRIHTGLFESIYDGSVTQLGVVGVVNVTVVNQPVSVGAIASRSNGTITQCYTDVAITITSDTQCAAAGITGDLTGTISDCYTVGNITVKKGNYDIGGITCYTKENATLTDCYATGALLAEDSSSGRIGGITAQDFKDGRNSPKNCIALNSQITKGDSNGRIVGYGTPLNCYASQALSGWSDASKNGFTLPTDIKLEEIFTNKEAWTFTEGSFPTLTAFAGKEQPTPPSTEDHEAEALELNLSNLSKATTLTCTDGQWIYKNKYQTGFFNGTVKGITTQDIIAAGTGTLILTDKVSLENITAATDAAITLTVAKGGTATINGGLSDVFTVTTYDEATNGRLQVYGESTDAVGLMQWTWKKALEESKDVILYNDKEEEMGITFACPTGNAAFATNIPDDVTVKITANKAPQQGLLKTGETIEKNPTNKFVGTTTTSLISFVDLQDVQPANAPDKNTGITITSGNTYTTGDDTEEIPFNKSVTGPISFITINAALQDASITLSDVMKDANDATAVTDVTVKEGAKVELTIENKNAIALLVEKGSTLTLTAKDREATLTGASRVINNGTFIGETRLIKNVTGAAPLAVTDEPADKEMSAGSSHTLTVEASSTDENVTLTYQWTIYNPETEEWDEIPTTSADSRLRTSQSSPTSASYTTNKTGEYRCLVTCQMGNAVTSLSTRSGKVTLKSEPAPTVYYTVTLPAFAGFTTDPAAGVHQIEEWADFIFSLTLDEAYNQSKPVVTTSRGETLTPRASDGKYEVSFVSYDIHIAISGIEMNIPTGIDDLPSGTRVWTAPGKLCLHTDSPANVQIYTLSGHLQKNIVALNGEIALPLSAGNYVVVVNNRSYKVQVRQ